HFTGSQSSLVRSRRSRLALWKTTPVPLDLRSLFYIGGAGGLFARSRPKPPGLEGTRRVSRRSSLPGILLRHRVRSSHGSFGTDGARNQKVFRREIPSDHRTR